MLSLLIGLLIGYGQTGVRLDAFIPVQNRAISGRVAAVGDEVWILTGAHLFVGECSYIEVRRNRAFLIFEGRQDGTEAVAFAEVEDNTKQDLGYIVIVQFTPEGDFGLPGRGVEAFPMRRGGDAVTVFGGGK